MIEIREMEMVFKSNKKEKNGLTIIFILVIVSTILAIEDWIEYHKELLYETSAKDMYLMSFCLGGICILIYTLLICSWIGVRRTIIINKDGCRISFRHYQKIYKWEDFKVRAEVDFSHTVKSLAESAYTKGVIFSTHANCRSRWGNLLSVFHPLSFIGIYFSPKEKFLWRDENYEVDEEMFLGKMKEWGIELEKIVYNKRIKNSR